MAYQIIEQPNKKLALWDTIEQSVLMWDATTDELIDYMAELERRRIKDKVHTIVAKLRNGKKPYAQFTLGWSDVMQMLKEAHGWEAVGEILDNMERVEVPG